MEETDEIDAVFQSPDLSPAFCLSSCIEDPDEEAVCADPRPTEPAGVECGVCTGRKRKAERSCLECVESYCEDHLELHNILHGGKRHKLVEAAEGLQERMCPEHGRLLEVFCRTDQQCICHLCITDTHRTHDVVSIEDEVSEKKLQLENMRKKTTERIQIQEKEEQELRNAIDDFEVSAEAGLMSNEEFFTELIQSIESTQCAVTNLIKAQKEAVVKEAEELTEKLQLQITDFKERNTKLQHLEQLYQEGNNISFLQAACFIPPTMKIIRVPLLLVPPYSTFEPTTVAVSELIEKVTLVCKWRFITISERVKNTGIVSSPLLTTRQELLKYGCSLTLDPNTVHDRINLGLDNRLLTAVRESEYYPAHPERFVRRVQALCKEGLRGSPKYWEVKCGMKGVWTSVAVAYKGIRRSGRQAPLFGRSGSSWALRIYGYSCKYWHDDESKYIQSSSIISRIGVYLDHGAGVLAFYSVSDKTRLLHKVQTRFTEPVYVGFGLAGIGSQIKLCDLDPQD